MNGTTGWCAGVTPSVQDAYPEVHDVPNSPITLQGRRRRRTVDGVMQGNGGASDDRRNGFERGGWALGKGDDETRTFITQTYQGADAFLFGRWTYELFAGSWGAIADMQRHPIGVALNETPKYVASTTLTDPQWAKRSSPMISRPLSQT